PDSECDEQRRGHRNTDADLRTAAAGLAEARVARPLVRQPEGSDFDVAEERRVMFRGHLYRLVEARAFDHVKAAYPFLGLGERPIRCQDLAVSFANGDRLIWPGQTVAGDSDTPAVHFGDP